MAVRCSPNGGAGSRIVVGELRISFWVLSILRTAVLKQVVLAGKYGLEYGDFVVCQCWTWTNMLNYVYL